MTVFDMESSGCDSAELHDGGVTTLVLGSDGHRAS